MIKKRKKKKKEENALVENEFVEKPYSELRQILNAILMYLSGIPYIYIWMQTKFYLHDREFFDQPYMLQAIGLPAILLTIMFLADFKFNNIFRLGDKKIGEIIFVAIASYITVACVLGSYILGIIILGFFGMIITSFF